MLFLIILFLSFISCNGSDINQKAISFNTNQDVVINKKEILLSHQEIVGKARLGSLLSIYLFNISSLIKVLL